MSASAAAAPDRPGGAPPAARSEAPSPNDTSAEAGSPGAPDSLAAPGSAPAPGSPALPAQPRGEFEPGADTADAPKFEGAADSRGSGEPGITDTAASKARRSATASPERKAIAAREPRAPRASADDAFTPLPPLDSGFPWERSPLAGISSTTILAELQRRRERSAQLLAERERILAFMQAIEERLELIGHDVAQLSGDTRSEGLRKAKAGRAEPTRARRTEASRHAAHRPLLPGGRNARATAPTAARGARSKAGARGRGRPAGGTQESASRRSGQGARSSSATKTSGSARGAGARQAKHAARASNTLSLREAIAQAVEPRALVTPAEAAELVKQRGYVSTAANFGMLVANALARDERFRRLGRGSYERIG